MARKQYFTHTVRLFFLWLKKVQKGSLGKLLILGLLVIAGYLLLFYSSGERSLIRLRAEGWLSLHMVPYSKLADVTGEIKYACYNKTKEAEFDNRVRQQMETRKTDYDECLAFKGHLIRIYQASPGMMRLNDFLGLEDTGDQLNTCRHMLLGDITKDQALGKTEVNSAAVDSRTYKIYEEHTIKQYNLKHYVFGMLVATSSSSDADPYKISPDCWIAPNK